MNAVIVIQLYKRKTEGLHSLQVNALLRVSVVVFIPGGDCKYKFCESK